MDLPFSFAGETVLVTGGTRGIGAAVARGVLSCQGEVIVTGTAAEPPDWLRQENGATGISLRARYWQLDFAAPAWPQKLDALISQIPRIDACVNNAGINVLADIREVREQDLRRVLEVNLVAPALVTSCLGRRMAKSEYGRIVNISSIFGVGSRAGRSSYSASKAGLIGQTRACALDLASDGILVNAICPGFVETDLTRSTLGEEGMARMVARIPVGRLAQCEDIVPAVLFLASRSNTYVTGQVLVVDGGYLID